MAALRPEKMTRHRKNGSGVSSVEYVFDDTLNFGGWLFPVQQVAYELRIGKLQKRVKCLLIGHWRLLITMFEIAQQQFVELAHATPALPG
jgi:hypothetical protein